MPSGCWGASLKGDRACGKLLGRLVAEEPVGSPPVLMSVLEGWMRMVVGSQDSESVIVPVTGTLVPVKVGVASVVVEPSVVVGVMGVNTSELETGAVVFTTGGKKTLEVGVVMGGSVSEAEVVALPGTLVGGGGTLDSDTETVAGSEMVAGADVEGTGGMPDSLADPVGPTTADDSVGMTITEDSVGVTTADDPVGMTADDPVGMTTADDSVGMTMVDDSVPLVIGVAVGTGITVGRREVRSMPLFEVETGSLVGTTDDSVVVGKRVGNSVGKVIP